MRELKVQVARHELLAEVQAATAASGTAALRRYELLREIAATELGIEIASREEYLRRNWATKQELMMKTSPTAKVRIRKMINSIEVGRSYLIEATGPQGLEEDLDAALEAVLEQAIKDGRYGILVTRHGNTTFTVATSTAVPYGQIFEENGPAWTRRSTEDPDPGGS